MQKDVDMNNNAENKISGILELDGHRGGSLRALSFEMERHPGDPRIGPDLIRKYRLRDASWIEPEPASGPPANTPQRPFRRAARPAERTASRNPDPNQP